MSRASRRLLTVLRRRGGGALLVDAWAEYLFDTGSGTSLVDASGNSRNLTLGFAVGAAAYPSWGVVDGIQCLTFAGTNNVDADIAAINTMPTLAQPFTVCSLVRQTASGNGGVISGNNAYDSSIWLTGSKVKCIFGGTARESGTITADSTWHTVVVSVNGSSSWVSVDGVAASISTPGSAGLTTGWLHIGALYHPVSPLNGNIGYIGIFPIALDSADAAKIHSEIREKRGL